MITILGILVFFGISTVQASFLWTEGYHQINTNETYDDVTIINNVTLNIFGGTITTSLLTGDNTLTNWYAGQIDRLGVYDNAVVNIYGGSLQIGLWLVSNSQVNLYAHDIILTHTGGNMNHGQISGTYNLNPQQTFTFDLWDADTYTHINIVPEPSTILLLGIGCLLLRRKK